MPEDQPQYDPIADVLMSLGAQSPPVTGMRVPGNIDMSKRPLSIAQGGTPLQAGQISTIRSMSFGTPDGEVLVPTIDDDGKPMTNDQAIRKYQRTGQHLGIFRSPQDATAHAERLHQQEEERVTNDPIAQTVAWLNGGGTSQPIRPQKSIPGPPPWWGLPKHPQMTASTVTQEDVDAGGHGFTQQDIGAPVERLTPPGTSWSGPAPIVRKIDPITGQWTEYDNARGKFAPVDQGVQYREDLDPRPKTGFWQSVTDIPAFVGDTSIGALSKVAGGAPTQGEALYKAYNEPGKTMGGRIGDVVRGSAAFAADFMLTGGLQSTLSVPTRQAVRSATTGLAKGGLGETLLGQGFKFTRGGKIVEQTADMFARGAAVMPMRIGETLAGAMDEAAINNEDFTDALAKNAADQFTEVASENSGEILNTAAGFFIPKRLAILKSAILAKWVGNKAGRTFYEGMQKVAKAGGWHGVMGEIGEEYVGGYMKKVAGIQDFSGFSPQELLEMGIAFAVPGGAMNMGAGTLNVGAKMKAWVHNYEVDQQFQDMRKAGMDILTAEAWRDANRTPGVEDGSNPATDQWQQTTHQPDGGRVDATPSTPAAENPAAKPPAVGGVGETLGPVDAAMAGMDESSAVGQGVSLSDGQGLATPEHPADQTPSMPPAMESPSVDPAAPQDDMTDLLVEFAAVEKERQNARAALSDARGTPAEEAAMAHAYEVQDRWDALNAQLRGETPTTPQAAPAVEQQSPTKEATHEGQQEEGQGNQGLLSPPVSGESNAGGAEPSPGIPPPASIHREVKQRWKAAAKQILPDRQLPSESRVDSTIQHLVRVIETGKDTKGLLTLTNRVSRQVFSDVTGVKLPNTESGTRAALVKYRAARRTSGTEKVEDTGEAAPTKTLPHNEPMPPSDRKLPTDDTPENLARRMGHPGNKKLIDALRENADKKTDTFYNSVRDALGSDKKASTAIDKMLESAGLVNPGDTTEPKSDAATKNNYAHETGAPKWGEVANHFATHFVSPPPSFDSKSIVAWRSLFHQLTGNKVEAGTPMAKQVDEAIEVAVVKAARFIVDQSKGEPGAAASIYDQLVDLYEHQPNLNVRTSQSKMDQAFSTPAPIAWVASVLAGVTDKTTVYEPSAGNGLLLIGADASLARANELNRNRQGGLKEVGFKNVTGKDATEASVVPDASVDVVIANPPFGEVKDDNGHTKTWSIRTGKGTVVTRAIDQAIVIRSLQAMKPDGRAVFIVGSKQHYHDRKTDGERKAAYNSNVNFFLNLFENWKVTDMFTIDGDLYKKQGAGWSIDVIVVDGKGKSELPRPDEQLPRIYTSFDQLRSLVDGTTTATGNAVGRTLVDASGGDQRGPDRASSGVDRGRAGNEAHVPTGPVNDVGGTPRGGEPGGPSERGGQTLPGVPGVEAGSGGPRSRTRVGSGQSSGGDGGSSAAGATGGARNDAGDGGGVPQPRSTPKGRDTGGARGPADGAGQSGLTEDERAEMESLARELRDKLTGGGGATAPGGFGLPPSLFSDPAVFTKAVRLSFLILKQGAHTFKEWARAMVKMLGEGAAAALKPLYLALFKSPESKSYHDRMTAAAAVRTMDEKAVRETIVEEPKQEPNPESVRTLDGEREAKDVEKIEEGVLQVPYTPHSSVGEAMGTLVPSNLRDALQTALSRANEETGGLDKLVMDRLGWTPEHMKSVMGAEQIDSVALAIWNHERGRAMILGSQTGIGKGRVCAAMLGYFMRKGMTPTFITAKPMLYKDIIRDLEAIGYDGRTKDRDGNILPKIRPLVLNSGLTGTAIETDDMGVQTEVEQSISLDDIPGYEGDSIRTPSGGAAHYQNVKTAIESAEGGGPLAHPISERDRGKGSNTATYNMVFSTYDQLSPVGGQNRDEVDPSLSHRQGLMLRFITRAVNGAGVILDESHNAAGAGGQAVYTQQEEHLESLSQPGGKNTGARRAWFLRQIINGARGVMYSSATFAATPAALDMYSRTSLGQMPGITSVAAAEQIKAGGVPMQQAVALMLTEAGQYVAHQRDFAGAKFNAPSVVQTNREHVDAVASSLMHMSHLDDAISAMMDKERKYKPLVDWLSEQIMAKFPRAQAGSLKSHTPGLFSVIHNLIDASLLTLKIDETARRVAECVAQGRKPVIVLDRTSETMIREFADDAGLKIGDVIPHTFADVMQRTLDRLRQITVKDARTNEFQRFTIPMEVMSPGALDAYQRAAESISTGPAKNYPASPIDMLLNKLEKAGVKVGELTGRSVRIDYSGAQARLAERPAFDATQAGKIGTVKRFNGGMKGKPVKNPIDALLVNRAATAGISAHASSTFHDQRQREMFLVQMPPSITDTIQLLGRIFRTGQVVGPIYTPICTDLPHEIRAGSALMKKMASMNANTSGARKGMFSIDVPDMFNQIGSYIAANFLLDNPDIENALGVMGTATRPETVEEIDPLDPDGIIRKMSGRMPVLSLATQEGMWKSLIEDYNAELDYLSSVNRNPLQAVRMDLNARPIGFVGITEGQESSADPFDRPATLLLADVDTIVRPMQFGHVMAMIARSLGQEKASDDLEDPELVRSARAKNAAAWTAVEAAMKAKTEQAQKDIGSAGMAAAVARAADVMDEVKSFLSTYRIGQTVEVSVQGVKSAGVIIDIPTPSERSIFSKNRWRLVVAQSSGEPRAILPMGLMQTLGSEPAMVSATPIDVSNRDKAFGGPIREAFDAGAEVTREQRVLAVNNLVRAMATLGGPSGTVPNARATLFNYMGENAYEQGVLLPGSFDATAYLLNQEPVLRTVEHLSQMMADPDTMFLKTADDNLKVRRRKGAWQFEAPARDGEKYWGDKKLWAALGHPETGFTMAGGTYMVRNVPTDVALRGIAHLIQQGGQFKAGDNVLKAAQIVGQPTKMKPAEARPKPGGGTFNTPKYPGSRSGAVISPGEMAYLAGKAISAVAHGAYQVIKLAGTKGIDLTKAIGAHLFLTTGRMSDSLGNVTDLFAGIWGDLAGKALPRMTRAARRSGEAGVRYASAASTAQIMGERYADMIVGKDDAHANKVGAVLVEDNLRSIRKSFQQAMNEATLAGDEDEAEAMGEAADAVRSLVGPGEFFETEADYLAALKDDKVQESIDAYREHFMPVMDDLYRRATGIAEDEELPTRGAVTEARVNLKALTQEEASGVADDAKSPQFTERTRTFLRKSRFAQQAKGNARFGYDTSLRRMIGNSVKAQIEIAAQREWYNQLVADGLAVIGELGQRDVEIDKHPVVAVPIRFRSLVIKKPDGSTQTVGQSHSLYIRKDLFREFDNAIALTAGHGAKSISWAMRVWNTIALIGPIDATTHLGNIFTCLATRPGLGQGAIGRMVANAGAVGVPAVLAHMLTKVGTYLRYSPETQARIEYLTRIGAIRAKMDADVYGNKDDVIGWKDKAWEITKTIYANTVNAEFAIRTVDMAARLAMDEAFSAMVRSGLVKDTDTNRREFINQLGQYNRRLQEPFRRWMRESGIAQFITAGATFTTLGARNLTMSPGAEASGPAAAVALRAAVLARWAGTLAAIAALNLLLSNPGDDREWWRRAMGRPGVAPGMIDTGETDERGRPVTVDLLEYLGYRRAARVVGLDAASKAYFNDLPAGTVIDAAAKQSILTAFISPHAGPPVRTAAIALTGHDTGGNRVAPVVPPGESQAWANIKAAGLATNQFTGQMNKPPGDRSFLDAIIPRYTPKTGRSDLDQATLPQRVEGAQRAAYIDDLAARARKVKREDRVNYINSELSGVDPVTAAHARRELFGKRRIMATP